LSFSVVRFYINRLTYNNILFGYNILETMKSIETNQDANTLLLLNDLVDIKVMHESIDDFLTFDRQMAPPLVSDFKMGKHIEVISDKLRPFKVWRD
jgi:hypothetical protein